MFAEKMGYRKFTQSLPKSFSGHIPGSFDRKDDVHLAVSRGERVIVLTPRQWQEAGEHLTPHLKQARVPGFNTGGGHNIPSSNSSTRSNNDSDEPLEINVENLTIDVDAEKLFVEGAKTNKGQRVVFRIAKMGFSGKIND
jgi:hypothetical protein